MKTPESIAEQDMGEFLLFVRFCSEHREIQAELYRMFPVLAAPGRSIAERLVDQVTGHTPVVPDQNQEDAQRLLDYCADMFGRLPEPVRDELRNMVVQLVSEAEQEQTDEST